jgi:hypothetical protein
LIFLSTHIHLAMPGFSPAQALSLLGGQGEGKAPSVLFVQLPQGFGEADGGIHALRRAPQVKVLLTEALSSNSAAGPFPQRGPPKTDNHFE